jgi:Bacterial PH domain
MTMSGSSAPEPTRYAPRTYRSGPGILAGLLLLVVGCWFVGDAVLYGDGRAPWLSLAGLLLGAPLVIAFTLRPAVFAGDDRLTVRNPFRTITVPWAKVESLRIGYTTEVVTERGKFQLWAIPVSLRQRKKEARQQGRAAVTKDPFLAGRSRAAGEADAPRRPWADAAVDELRELADRNRGSETADGELSVRWAFEVVAPTLAGVVVLVVLLAMG